MSAGVKSFIRHHFACLCVVIFKGKVYIYGIIQADSTEDVCISGIVLLNGWKEMKELEISMVWERIAGREKYSGKRKGRKRRGMKRYSGKSILRFL